MALAVSRNPCGYFILLRFYQLFHLWFQAHKLITDWGMDIDNDTVRLVGRVLPPETLYFANGKSETIGPKGEWNRAATNSVLTAVSLTKWAIFFPEKNKAIVQNFCKELQRVASRMGIQMANPKVHIFISSGSEKESLDFVGFFWFYLSRNIGGCSYPNNIDSFRGLAGNFNWCVRALFERWKLATFRVY